MERSPRTSFKVLPIRTSDRRGDYRDRVYDIYRVQKTYVTSKKFCLILPEDDEYTKEHTYGAEYLRTYTPDNTSVSTITDYMTKNRDKIDV